MKNYSLVWLADELRKAGLKVVEVDGWKTRGRGDIGKIEFLICHHTATQQPGNSPSLWIVRDGRPDVQGPLSQCVLGRDGTWYVVAAGRANHAGKGVWSNMANVGNAVSIGTEAENNGLSQIDPPKGEKWSEVMLDSYARGKAAMLDYLKLPTSRCLGHKEYAPKRKIDPSFDMEVFRARVQKHRKVKV